MNGLAVRACGLLISAVLAAAGFPISAGTPAAGAYVSSGHRGAVLDVAEDCTRGLLFSVGVDGFLRVWDTVTGTVYFAHVLSPVAAIILGVLAVVFLLTSIVGTCPIYLLLGISTKRKPAH